VHLARRHPDAKPLLPLAGLAWKLHRRPERTEAKLRTLQRLEPTMPIALAALDALQAVHDHRRWRKVANRLLTRSYQLGIVDAIPDPAERREFLASAVVHEAAHTMAVWLDRPGPVELPCPVGMVDMSIGHGGRPLVTVPAVRSLGQWDWQTITEQAVSSLDESARLALALAQLTPPNPGAEPGRARREAA
jgi:hypothetical protein